MKVFLLTVFLAFISLCLFAQKITISGTVKDGNSGETLIGVNIFDKKNQKGAITNNYGFFSYSAFEEKVELVFSYVGYEPELLALDLKSDTLLTVELRASGLLKEVVIEGERSDPIQERTQMGSINVPIREIKNLPALMGEVDIFKVIQLLPGVQSGSEGTSGLYVRGGSPDQNLILLDGVPVYNASHLFGFFSVFNDGAINNVELIKGGFPARFGGRLSSVIDITMKEGNMKEFKGEGSIGLIASKITLEGPIKKDKTSFLFSGRRTYLDMIARPIIRKSTGGNEDVGYFFYDLNAKVNHIFDKKNRLYLSYYGGQDVAYSKYKNTWERPEGINESNEEAGLGWGNNIAAVRWNHIFNQRLFANFTGTFTQYKFRVFSDYDDRFTPNQGDGAFRETYSSDYFSGIRDVAFKADFDFIPNPDHYIRWGGMWINHRFTPGVFVSRENQRPEVQEGGTPSDSREFSAYIEDDFSLGDRFKFNIGAHFSGFLANEKSYTSFQPRFTARYLLNPNSSIKVSYVQMAQFIHLLTNAGLGLPTDLWVPSTDRIGPQESWQVAAGYFRKLGYGLELSVEGYYKDMQGVIEYQDGASFLNTTSDWQDKVSSGEGRSYGMEVLLQKKIGKTTGWIGYTLSKTERRFDDINFGDWFPFRYDRRHDISVTAVHQLSDRIDLSGTWVFGTGNFITVPTQRYQHAASVIVGNFNRFGGLYVDYFESRNNFQMRSYHRMDLGINFHKEKKWGKRTWNVSIYNVYSRLNPFYMDISYNYELQRNQLRQFSLFPIVPSASYRFTF
ncbi:TonB-dependent receptor [Algoriphagus boritolerans]|uniref:Outer membrane receptor for ferrienterochelin and colicins n=1 Tax=Algoriphagus boritolerans DSM 17298 = JCM 18970 TaxID=1120964 RepID=A0A1H5U6Z8_9BACT|nr:TonB-dependent receptor [Algoriphagus boritolerans]SEF70826.1 Outer membrane receptor for ferrienterochelin and colicins [Algoriphagus boritolerans DSM 17298 = JCM 18970]